MIGFLIETRLFIFRFMADCERRGPIFGPAAENATVAGGFRARTSRKNP